MLSVRSSTGPSTITSPGAGRTERRPSFPEQGRPPRTHDHTRSSAQGGLHLSSWIESESAYFSEGLAEPSGDSALAAPPSGPGP